MPARNRIKQYAENSYYHLYNRGVEKKPIFLDQQDYAVFLAYLKEYLSPKDEKALQERLADPTISYKERANILRKLRMNNFFDDIKLLAYCLMPNHFHFLLKQKSAQAIDIFMNSLGTRYTVYFNRKYKRVGSLYQDVYKAVLVGTDEQFLHLSRYIHRNPLMLSNAKEKIITEALQTQPSSYSDYLGLRNTAWVNSKEILSYFSQVNPSLSYESFVHETDDRTIIEKVSIDIEDS